MLLQPNSDKVDPKYGHDRSDSSDHVLEYAEQRCRSNPDWISQSAVTSVMTRFRDTVSGNPGQLGCVKAATTDGE